MQHELIDVLIVEDENELAQLHAELISKHPDCGWWGLPRRWLTRRQLESKQPQLMLLDNYCRTAKGSR
jgi:two-component system response regulator CitB